MKPLSCMPAVRTPEASQDTRLSRILDFCLPLRATRSATSTTIDFGADTPFTFIPACKPSCLRFAVTVTGHHARLGTRLLARLCRGGHPRPPNFLRFPRRNAHRTGRAEFRHPALRLASPQGTRRTANVGWCLATTPWKSRTMTSGCPSAGRETAAQRSGPGPCHAGS